jgi:transcriptional regulator with XRE-family HTH domain
MIDNRAIFEVGWLGLKAGKDINGRIFQVRKELGLSQKDFAAGIKVSRTNQSAFEGSGYKINVRIILIICTTYGVNETWLRNGTGEMFGKETNVRLEQAMRKFDKLDILLQDYVLKHIDLLLELQEKKGI